MRRFRDLSIRQQLFRVTVVTTGLALVLACAAFVLHDLFSFRAGLARDLSTLAEVIGSNSTAAVAFNDPKSAAEVLAAVRAKPRIVRAFIFTSGGSLFASYRRAGGRAIVPAPPPGDGQWFTGDELVLARGVVLAGERVGTVVVYSDLQEARERLQSYVGIVVGVFGASMLLALLVSTRMQRVVSAPILHLAQVARGISTDRNYGSRAVPRGGDESRLLIDAFNQMLDQIQSREAELEGQRAGLKIEVEKRTAMNEELEAARLRAEDASRTKSEFLANVSHEIRTPMNGIIGMTELTLGTTLNEEQREYLGMVHQSAKSLLSVINDILDFSKIEAGRLDLDSLEFSIRSELDSIVRSVALRAHEKGLELICDVEPDIPDALVGDSARLRQVLVNLVGNAIKFTDMGEIVLRVSAVAVEQDQARLRFSVADTGIGIPLDKQALIFQPFTQADGSTTRRFGGTGLGLTISSRLTELMGGHLGVESRPGRGSTFSFSAVFGVAPGHPAQSQPPVALDGMAVLVVDDNRTNRVLLERMLANWKMLPTSVGSAPDALTLLNAGPQNGSGRFRVAVLDMNMPGMSGLELADRIKQDPELKSMTLLMLTSSSLPGESARCRAIGLDGYLTKPVTRAGLLDALLRALAVGDSRSPAPSGGTLPVPARSAGRLRILVAEDNIINQKLVVRLLERRGHDVTLATTGVEALAAWERQPFDLVLMDVQMPELNGLDATAGIRERERATGEHVPIVAMTAHAMKGDRERCLQGGMDGYLSKPVETSQLDSVLSAVTPAAAAHAPRRSEAASTGDAAALPA
jgi:signal transduction histidine kinase/DNA-binding response OmpR family regulator